MPELVGAFIDGSNGGNAAEVDKIFSATAQKHQVFILVGVFHAASPKIAWNQARLYSPDGKVVATDDKHHLLQGFEAQSCTVGATQTTIAEPPGLWGIAICLDLDFPELGRR